MARKDKKVASTTAGSKPSREEISILHRYLSEAGLKRTASALEAEVSSQDVHVSGDVAEAPSLSDLLELWRKGKVPESKLKKTKEVKEGSSSSGESDSDSSDSSSDSDSDDSEAEDESEGHKAGMVDEEEEEVEVEDAKMGAKRKREATPSPSSSEDSSGEDSSASDSEDSSSDEDDAPPAKRTKVEASSDSSSDSSSDDDSDSSSSASEAAGDVDMDADTSSASSDSDSDSEASDSDSSSSDSDSDSSSDSASSPPTKKKAKLVTSKPEPDSDSSAPSSHTLTGSPAKPEVTTDVKTKVDEIVVPAEAVENGNGDMHPDRLRRMPATKQTVKQLKKSNVPFSRIPKDTKVDEKFKSNEYVPYDYANKAYQDLVVTKGKGFTKEKNKKKRGAYRGGTIDLAPKGIKFDD